MVGVSKENVERITVVACTTTASVDAFTIEVHHDWSPNGAARFVALVKDDFFTGVSLFRCVKNFLVQFGVSPDAASPKKKYWRKQGSIKDDPGQGKVFKRGTLSFAGSGVDSRGTQLFITYSDLGHLGKPESPWETPVGVVTQGMESVVDKFYQGYGDQFPFNKDGINQGTLQQRGNDYLRENFPEVSYLKECRVVSETHPELARSPIWDDKKQKAKNKRGGDDDGLWAASQGLPPKKQGPEDWVAHGEWLHHASKQEPRDESAGPAVSNDPPPIPPLSAAAAPAEEVVEVVEVAGLGEVENVPFPAFVFLALALGAVFVVWKKSKKGHRRNR